MRFNRVHDSLGLLHAAVFQHSLDASTSAERRRAAKVLPSIGVLLNKTTLRMKQLKAQWMQERYLALASRLMALEDDAISTALKTRLELSQSGRVLRTEPNESFINTFTDLLDLFRKVHAIMPKVDAGSLAQWKGLNNRLAVTIQRLNNHRLSHLQEITPAEDDVDTTKTLSVSSSMASIVTLAESNDE
jgi:hypothetical protein